MPPKARSAAGAAAGPPPPPGPAAPPRQRGKPRGIRRDRDCITCKTRGLKCDLNRPQCLPCVQAGITCGGYPLRVVWLDERRRGAGKAAAGAAAGPAGAAQSMLTMQTSLPPPAAHPSGASAHQSGPPSHLSGPPSHLSGPSSNPAHPAHSTHPAHPVHPAHPAHPAHPTHPTHQTHPSYPPRSLPVSSFAYPRPPPPATAPATSPATTYPPIINNSLCSSPDELPVTSPPVAPSLASSRTPPSAASPSITGSITTSAAGDEAAWCETDQNSLIKRLAALCNHILTTEDIQATAHNHYLAQPETTALLSDLCVFIQARLEGRNPPPAVDRGGGDHDQQQENHPPAVKKPPESLDMVRSRLTALARVNRAIEAANPFAFLGIATFAVFEVCDDSFGEWQCHLHGARHLLEYHRCRTLADLQRLATLVPGLMDILARLVWFDLSGSVVRGSVLAADGASPATCAAPLLIFEDWHRQVLLDSDIYETVGISPDTCALYVDVAKARLLHRPVQACLRAAEQVLKVEDPPKSKPASTPTPTSAASAADDWIMAKNVHRCAAALAVLGQVQAAQDQAAAERSSTSTSTSNNTSSGSSMADPDMLEDRAAWEATTCAAVDKLCAALNATPPSSRFYIHLAVGAYMAGMRARTQEHCAAVRQYWLNCSISGISRYPGGLSRCNEHWRRIGLLPPEGAETPVAMPSHSHSMAP